MLANLTFGKVNADFSEILLMPSPLACAMDCYLTTRVVEVGMRVMAVRCESRQNAIAGRIGSMMVECRAAVYHILSNSWT